MAFPATSDLPWEDKNSLLLRLIEGEDVHLSAELRRRANREIRGEGVNAGASQSRERRSVGTLLARADVIEKQRRKRESVEAARKKAELERAQAEQRKEHLESIGGKEKALWAQVDKLIATKQPKRYDEAVQILKELHDLADMKGTGSEFEQRMSALHQEHTRKPSLIARFREAKLSS
ncbi:MAG: hypothetical protein V2B18_11850 [Pseudomonadota bacterium]